MKVKITYQDEEETAVVEDVQYYRNKYGGIKVHKSDIHPPFKHIYLATRAHKRPHDTSKID